MTPLPFRWDGESMVPERGFQRRADEQFVIGERYVLVEHHERSTSTHNHEFAWIADAWASLPEHLTANFPSPEHLRKWALIQAGFCDVQDVPCASEAEVLRIASVARTLDGYCVVIPKGRTARVCRARSQARGAMDRAEFQASKDGIIRVVSDLLEVTPAQLLSGQGAGGAKHPVRAAA